MLVVDECHRAGAEENSRALRDLHEATLGLSATPERESDDGFELRIVPALGPIVYAYDYPEAKADGVIVDLDLVNIEIALDRADVDRLILSEQRENLVRRNRDQTESKRLHGVASTKDTVLFFHQADSRCGWTRENSNCASCSRRLHVGRE